MFVVKPGAALALLAALALPSCTRPAPDATPEGAVRQWLDRMEATSDDPRAIREAYALLGPTARANLEERAARASRLEGHGVDPWEMLAEGRFGLKFRPKTMVSRVDGDGASVEVTGDEPLSQHARVRCVRETGDLAEPAEAKGGKSTGEPKTTKGGWRVEPDLPPVSPLPRRDPDPAPPKATD